MSITRRQFILGTAAGLILPSFYDKVITLWENGDEVLLEAPPQADIELLAVDRGGPGLELNLGDPYDEPVPLTIREFAQRYGFDVETFAEEWWGCDQDDIDLDSPMDEWAVIDLWARNDSPNARAYRLLEPLDLGPDLTGPNAVGEIVFTDGACPGNDYLGVEAPTYVDVSLLQKRLNDLKTGIRVSIA
jgi:hypothetical protein